MLPKPETCSGCSLERLGQGWVPREGSPLKNLAIIAEAAGAKEAAHGSPLHPTGESGGMFNRWLQYAGVQRAGLLVHNVLSCRPPANELKGTGYAEPAIKHCRPNLDATLSQPGVRAVLALGGTATRELLQLPPNDFELKDWHGCVVRDPTDSFWVIPTFHPAHITRGAHSLTQVCVNDLARAARVAQEGWTPEGAEIVVDPPLDWWEAWVDMVLAAYAQDPTIWMADDTETEGKARDEGTLKSGEGSAKIVRHNFSISPKQGVTVTEDPRYRPGVARLYASGITKVWWYKHFDLPRVKLAGYTVNGVNLDMMWAWHQLQSDVPRGLGFVSPLFSGFGPWKHLSDSNPGYYAGVDPVQTLRNALGIARYLHEEQRWEAFWRHMHLVDQHVFWPSCDVGLRINREKLEGTAQPDGTFAGGYKQQIDAEVERLWNLIQTYVPEEVRLLDPKGGLKRKPEGDERKNPDYEKNPGSPEVLPIIELVVEDEIRHCETCGAEGAITFKHVCKDEKGKPDRTKVPIIAKIRKRVPRWFIRRQFNPNSSQQMLAVLDAWGDKPGKNKDGNPSADKLTLERLKKHSKADQGRWFYGAVLEYRAVKKLKAGYVDAIIRQLDESEDGRLHPEVTHKPSTQRTSYIHPNLQNLPTRNKLSEGFRECVEAGEG